MKAEDIARYLQDHPDFFDRHADLLANLSVPHPTGGQAISLTERQLHTLREKLRQVQDKLAELITFGEENDAISDKVHRLAVALIQAESFESVAQTVYTHLIEHFAVPHVLLRVWNSILKRDSAEFIHVSEELRFFAADLRHPYCGPAQPPEVVGWFGDASAHLRSIALVPLRRDAQVFGLLALGSEDPERFFPEMGTLYVERIGELVSAAVLRQIG